MKRIKLTIAQNSEKCNRQIPGCGFVWKGYEFIINKPCDEADYWVYYSKGMKQTESCRVAPENTMFITGEPDSTYHYSQGFINQFGKVLSCQVHLKHQNLVPSQPGLPWHIGRFTQRIEGSGKEVMTAPAYSHTYDDLKLSNPTKTKLMSVITSNKAFTKGHRERISFVLKLKEYFGDEMDLYGWGFNNFQNKWDVIAPYRYHVALENCSIPHYWSEKLADTYLGNAFPFYFGCENLDLYFDKRAFIRLDIHDVDGAIQRINKAIAENVAGTHSQYIEEAKQLILDKYNLFNLIVENIQDMNPDASKVEYTIKHDMCFFDWHKLYIMGWNRIANNSIAKFMKSDK